MGKATECQPFPSLYTIITNVNIYVRLPMLGLRTMHVLDARQAVIAAHSWDASASNHRCPTNFGKDRCCYKGLQK